MTGHLIRARIRDSLPKLFRDLIPQFGNIYANMLGENGKRVGVIAGEKWFFRTGSYAAILIFIQEASAKECILDIIAYAGGTGLIDVSWGAHPKYAREVIQFLVDKGYEIAVELEIDNFSIEKLPADIREKLGWSHQ